MANLHSRQGAARVLCGIKTSLGKMKGCMLKRRMIEAVADHLCAALDQLVEAAERDKNASADKDGSECAKPSKLQPSLKVGFFFNALVPFFLFDYISVSI